MHEPPEPAYKEYESTGTPVVWYKTRPLAELPAWVRAELNQAAERAHAA